MEQTTAPETAAPVEAAPAPQTTEAPAAQDLQTLKDNVVKEREKFDREVELRQKIQALESEKEQLKTQSTKSTQDYDTRELMISAREYALENHKKYPVINATNSVPYIVEEMKKYKERTGKKLSFDDAFSTIEGRIEEYEISKAERLKGTPLYEKLYGKREEKEEQKPKPEAKEQPKKSAVKTFSSKMPSTSEVFEQKPSRVTREEAHRAAYEAYVKSKG